MCYAIPLAPALRVLLTRDDDPYVRLHAARALLFYALVALAQCGAWVLLVVGGSIGRGTVAGALTGLVFYGYVALEIVLVVRAWRAHIASALLGENPLRGRLGRPAGVIEAWSRHGIAWLSARWSLLTIPLHPVGRPGAEHDRAQRPGDAEQPRRRSAT